ncbi:MAG: hypothetical protein A2W99_00460 [Bacteroidetes bacterium GWF2_33_16]|nr:MAG: hypothetical protein A2X00_03165 [Bacteroidetes bacterium GWE2_32_14]OFY08745.1 MAG: hypothetical protein A2W99_00460 [Bacteroidetes bacterium GWF2_33_16]
MIIDFFETTKIFGLDFFHAENFYYLVTRFLYNLFWVFIPAYYLYFKKGGYREYFFTYIIVSIMVFQICLLLGSVSLRLGFALGLFAIFGILRYRTNPIPPREMTYLFLVIGISIKNAVSNENISFIELITVDVLTILVTFLVESYITGMRVKRKKIIYDRLELAKPENHEELKKDLSERLGVEVVRVDLGPADLIKDSIELLVFFKEAKGIRFYDAPR